MQAIKCGADPEVLVYGIKTGKVVPCINKVPGTKDFPFVVEGSKVGLKIQEDNISLEFNINPVPLKQFSSAMATAQTELQLQVQKYFGKDFTYMARPAAEFKKEELEHPQAQAFGCDPDFMAYERGAMRIPPDPKQVGNMRFAGGHLHVGFNKKPKGEKGHIPDWAIVQGMELGGYLIDIYHGNDVQGGRRKFYGLAGLYRPKPYGLEYRTPSNYWLDRRACAENILRAAQNIINRPAAYKALHGRVDWEAVRKYINSEGASRLNLNQLLDLWEDFVNTPEE